MTSITRNLPKFISQPAIAIIGQQCYTTLVEDLNITDAECLKLSLSKVLGIGIVVGGSIMKVPQILLITKAESAQGLSLPAYVLETLGYAFSLAYSARNGFPFSTYGENFFLTLQNLFVTFLIIYYKRGSVFKQAPSRDSGGVAAAAVLSGLVGFALFNAPTSSLPYLQLATLPISLSSKIPQILENSSAQSTGQLSTVAVAAQVAGCLARLFTTATEVGDPIVLWGFVLALVLNLVIAVQMWAYWGNAPAVATPTAVLEKRREQASNEVPTTAAVSWGQANEKASVPTAGYMAATPQAAPSPNRRWSRKVD